MKNFQIATGEKIEVNEKYYTAEKLSWKTSSRKIGEKEHLRNAWALIKIFNFSETKSSLHRWIRSL